MNTRKLISTLILASVSLFSFSSHAWGPAVHNGNVNHDANLDSGFNFNFGINGRVNTRHQLNTRPIVLRGVNFEFDSARLTPASTKILDAVASTLNSQTDATFEISGHASSEGHELYNLDLSARRARSVRNYLVEKGVTASNLTAYGYGEYRPVVSNATHEGRKLNRRVELTPTYRVAMRDSRRP